MMRRGMMMMTTTREEGLLNTVLSLLLPEIVTYTLIN